MLRINPSADERAVGQLCASHLQSALHAMAQDGVVVLEQVINTAPLNLLKARMDQDSVELLAFCDAHGGNPRDRGHLQQGPPLYAPFVPEALVASTFVTQVLQALLGDGAFCEFYNGNTNCPDSTFQQTHLDAAHADLNAQSATPTSAVVLNVVPQDVDERNGALEMWPGSHRQIVVTPVPESVVHERTVKVPSIRGVMRNGDALLRDSRLWHRGVPNYSREFRHMIGLVFVTATTPRRRPLLFARDVAALINKAPIPFHAEFSDQPIDYLLGPTRAIYKRLQGPNAAKVTRH